MRLIRLLKNEIAKEAEDWVDEKIISQSQAEKICERYDVDFSQSKNHSLGYNVLVGLGYLFIGLAVITLLGANWEDIPRHLRMSLLIIITMATHGLALRKYLTGDQSGASGIFILGNIFYGASIILIAQIYHLGEHMPDGVFWWALGCLPIGVLISSSWVTLQSVLLALIWFFMEVELGFYPTLFPLFILGSLVVLYRGRASLILFATVVASIGFWFEYTLAKLWSNTRVLELQAEHLAVSVAMFVFAYITSHWLSQKKTSDAKDYGALLSLWSLRFGLIFMFIMSYKEPWAELIIANWEHQSSMLLLVIAFAVGSLWLAFKVNKLYPVILIVPLYVLSIVAVLLSDNANQAIYFQIVFNLILIATGVWLIIRGIHEGISHYFFLGVSSILLTAFMRYVDLIGDYVGGALLFMVFAILLLGSAKYWKSYQPQGGRA